MLLVNNVSYHFYSYHEIFIFIFLVSLQEKLGSGVVEPRSLEDEGIFVGKKPVVPTNLVHRAEKRILQECTVDNKVNEKNIRRNILMKKMILLILATRALVWS